jgi:hypothetical protein
MFYESEAKLQARGQANTETLARELIHLTAMSKYQYSYGEVGGPREDSPEVAGAHGLPIRGGSVALLSQFFTTRARILAWKPTAAPRFDRIVAVLTLAVKKGLDKGCCIDIRMPGLRYSYR